MVSSWLALGLGGQSFRQELDLRGERVVERVAAEEGDPGEWGEAAPVGPRAPRHPRARLPWAPTFQAWKRGVSLPSASASVRATLLDAQREAGV